ncbi:MAG: type VI secretion system baseplate subunit TssG [Myxococcota bacterium]
MAPESRRNIASLKEELLERPSAFEFFQAVRLLHKLRPDREGVGRDADPGREAVRFRSDTSFVFPEGDIREINAGEPGTPDEMIVKLIGIASPGSFGSLPTPYVEEVRRQERELKNPAMREFFDLFNHRLVALFYRAWERSRLPVLHDLDVDNAFESVLFATLGLLGPAFDARMPLDQASLLSRAGLLAMAPAPASAIESIVLSLFGVPARVVQFLPSWYGIDASDRSRLGAANARLGVDLNLGEQVLLVQSRFRVSVGPVDRKRFLALLPDGTDFAALSSVVRLAAGVEFDFDVQIVLAAAEVPETRLGGADAAQLGWTTWLRTEPFTDDARAAIFEPASFAQRAAGERRP